jgi:hypothetical protein
LLIKLTLMKALLLLLLLPFFSIAQDEFVIPNKSKTIIVKGVSFLDVCNRLLDSGYSISKKDNELQTAITEMRQYPKHWNAQYSINIRVVDSIAFISGTFTAPPTNPMFKNEPIEHQTDKKGNAKSKHIMGYPFLIMNQFARSFGKEISYKL